MSHTNSARNISWFGKLPCVGDFCSYNMSAYLLGALDDWLSHAMKNGLDTHGPLWTQAYFDTPIHGFVWAHNTLPALQEEWVVGVLMPSVDKAGRQFPFVLMEQRPACVDEVLSFELLSNWFFHAHSLCADALNEEWPLDKLNERLPELPKISEHPAHGKTMLLKQGLTHWFRIDCAAQVKWVMQCQGLPHHPTFDALLGLPRTLP